MTNYDLEEDVLLKYQIILSFIFTFTLFISITLSYNAMTGYGGKNKLYSKKDAKIILKINRIIAFLVSIGFLLINIFDKLVKEKYNLNKNSADLQILASVLTLISSLIVLYIAFNNSNGTISEENPEI